MPKTFEPLHVSIVSLTTYNAAYNIGCQKHLTNISHQNIIIHLKYSKEFFYIYASTLDLLSCALNILEVFVNVYSCTNKHVCKQSTNIPSDTFNYNDFIFILNKLENNIPNHYPVSSSLLCCL